MKYIPYVYKIYNKITKQYYCGSRTAFKRKIANPVEFWKPRGYFTSSKEVHALIDLYGVKSFRVSWIITFKTREQALKYEAKFLDSIDAANNTKWINKRNGDWKFFCAKFTKERRKKIQERMKGFKHKEETKNKMRIIMKGNKNCVGRTGKKHPLFGRPAWNRGIPMKESQKKKLRGLTRSKQTLKRLSDAHKGLCIGKIWINDGNKTKFINPNEYRKYKKLGFVKGRLTPWQ